MRGEIMNQLENKTIQQFGNEVKARLTHAAINSTNDAERTGIYLAYMILCMELLRVQNEATLKAVKDLANASVIADVEEILKTGNTTEGGR